MPIKRALMIAAILVLIIFAAFYIYEQINTPEALRNADLLSSGSGRTRFGR